MSLSRAGWCTCREGGERDGTERNGIDRERLFRRRGEIEIDVAAADGAADLRIDRAQVAVLVGQRLILRLLGQRVRDTVHHRALLGEQQGENEE